MPAKKTAASQRGEKKSTTKSSPKKAAAVLKTVKKTSSKGTPAKKSGAKKKIHKRSVKKRSAKKSSSFKATTPTNVLATLNQELNKTPKKVTEEPKAALRRQLSLAVLSPYRFPLTVEQIATGSARVVGMGFVVMGVFMTLLAATSFTSSLATRVETASQLATVYDANELVSDSEVTYTAITKPEAGATGFVVKKTSDSTVLTMQQMGASAIRFEAVDARGDVFVLGGEEKQPGTWQVSLPPTASGTEEYVVSARVSLGSYEYVSQRKNLTLAVTPEVATAAAPSTTTDAGLPYRQLLIQREHDPLDDTDDDGLVDFDEVHFYGFSTSTPDSDDDGVSDKDELAQNATSSRSYGISLSSLLQVTGVAKATGNAVIFSGTAPAKSQVVLAIPSAGVSYLARVDTKGIWRFEAPELPDGEHYAFLSFSDADGAALVSSKSFFFAKDTIRTHHHTHGKEITRLRSQMAMLEVSTLTDIKLVFGAISLIAVGLLLLLLFLYARKSDDTSGEVA
ncbi:MAG: hypothetical protein R3B69_00635 [Candidatus Paceibacterota bacterium]